MNSGENLQEWLFVIGYVSFLVFIAWRVAFSSSDRN